MEGVLMAIYRPIYTNIWKDPTFEEYKPLMKLIFIYLISNESTTESGIYPITIKTISNETQIPIQTVTQLLTNGLKNISYDSKNSFVFIKNFLKYNGGGRPDLLKKSIEKNFKNFDTPLWNEFIEIYPEYSANLQTVGKRLVNCCSEVASISNAISISNSNTNNIICSDLKAKSEPKPAINFNFNTSKWEGITDSDIDLWGKAYPAAVLDIEFAKMKSWILANGAKGKKKNWRAFITRWLTKCQDYGGTKNADVR